MPVIGTSLGIVLLCSAQHQQLCMVTVGSLTQIWGEDWLTTKGKAEASRKRPTARSSSTWELGMGFGTIVPGVRAGKSGWQVFLEGHQMWARRALHSSVRRCIHRVLRERPLCPELPLHLVGVRGAGAAAL